MGLENIYAKWKKPDTMDHILYDSVYMKYPQKANPQRQKDKWLPGVKKGGKCSSRVDQEGVMVFLG